MSLIVTSLFTACTKDEKAQPQFVPADEVSVTPRVRHFVENATTNAAVKDLSILDADSAEWYLEASLNYSVAEAWTECTDRILDSVEVAISMDGGGISLGTTSAAFLSLQNQVLSKLTLGENHLIVADARFPDVLGENFVAKVYLQIGSGYDKSVNANYGPNDFWGWGGTSSTCGCGTNSNAPGLCAHKRIESRVNAALGKIKPPCYFINVETRGVGPTNAQINFLHSDFPSGIPATPYKIYYCNQGAFNCPSCFSPSLMTFYTQGTWDVMQQIKPSGQGRHIMQHGKRLDIERNLLPQSCVHVWPSAMQLTGRTIIQLLASCPVALAMGQDSWSLVIPNTGQHIRITDCAPMGDGYLTTSVHFWGSLGSNSEALIGLLNPAGVLLSTRQLWPSAASADVSVLLHDTSSGKYHALGTLKSSSGQFRCFDYVLYENGTPIDSNRFDFPNVEFAYVDNGCLEPNGNVIIAAYGRTIGALAAEDKTIIYRISTTVDSLTSRTIQGNFLIAASDLTILNGDTVLIACEGSEFNFVEEKASYYKLHGPSLEVQERFLAGPYDGSSDTVLSNAVVKAALHIHPLASGRLIVSGSAASGQYAVIQKLDRHGRYISHFEPEIEFDHNYPGAFGGSAMSGADQVLFAMMANFFIGPPSPFMPTFPNRIEYFKLDTALNLLCSGIVDGFGENAYYFLDRIKPTADGGFLLMGGRMDLNATQPYFDGWIQKLPPTACVTGIAEWSNDPIVRVHPNPGTHTLMVSIEGLPDRSMTLRLTDISGKAIRAETMNQPRTIVDTSTLASGLYLYSVIDGDGQVIGSGKWIKE